MSPATNAADPVRVRRALLSVSDKTGLVDFARSLHARGIEVVSTGGSARALLNAGIPAIGIEDVTGSPEMLGGRVKTLHPKVHGGILARRDVDTPALEQFGITPIDLVCVNLYPFEATIAREGVRFDEAVEQIDIGGPCMIRAAAKNARWVACVTSPEQYADVLDVLTANDGHTTQELRSALARAAFARTRAYDDAIARYLESGDSGDAATAIPSEAEGETLQLGLTLDRELRYGENPHQRASVYRAAAHSGPSVVGADQLHGKPMSYNNVLDAAAALRLVDDLHRAEPERCAAAVIKHTNPCGAAVASGLAEAARLALEGDPLAAFGGIVALSRPVDDGTAELLAAPGSFFEIVIAPSFEADALERLRSRFANVRLLAVGPLGGASAQDTVEVRTVEGGALAQRADRAISDPGSWTHAAGPEPTPAQLRAARALELVVRGLTSNAVALGGWSEDGRTELVGAGAGQMDRVASCRIAIEKASGRAAGAIAVSDAFFPFPDGPTLLADAGVGMIVHPGGSKRDGETFEMCEGRGITCLTTGLRRFRH